MLGVGFHFLPRLRGAPPPRPGQTRPVFGLLLAGLALRVVAQPLLALGPPATPAAALRAGLLVSGVLELAGASLALALFARTLRRGPPARERGGFRQVAPFVLTAFGAFWLALTLNLLALIGGVAGGGVLSGGPLHRAAILLALHGFLLPIAVAMSARLFPLYFRTPLPDVRLLHAGLALALTGLALRLAGAGGGAAHAAGWGRLLQALAFGLFILALGVFAPRRPLPRQAVRPLADAAQLHALAAYGWLAATAVLLVWAGLTALGLRPAAPPDVEIHVLGAGFLTPLILGVGAHLLPGFARRPLRSPALVWLTLALANGAAILRVGPPLLTPWLAPGVASGALALSGCAGLAALLLFGVNLAGPRSSRAAAG